MTSKISNLPDEHHVVRHVSSTRLQRDENDKVLGVLPQAFMLRPEEEALSVNWVEFFKDLSTSERDTIWAMRRARRIAPNSKSGFAVGNVGSIKEVCRSRGTTVRVLHEPDLPDNPSHAAIRRLPREDLTLLEALAGEAFSRLVFNTDVPAEPS